MERKRTRQDGNPKHGGRYTRAYTIWCNMKARCDNRAHPQFKDYGGRGIYYDPRWADFAEFHADMGDPPEGLTLDRRNNDGPYSKRNCRWATRSEQARNTSQNRFVTLNGERMCIEDWCKRLGLKQGTVATRIMRGWTPKQALTTPLLRRR